MGYLQVGPDQAALFIIGYSCSLYHLLVRHNAGYTQGEFKLTH